MESSELLKNIICVLIEERETECFEELRWLFREYERAEEARKNVQ